MYAISNEYKEIIYSGDAKNKLKLLFNNVEYTNAGSTSESLKITSKILSNGNNRFSLDNFVSKEAELIIHDIDLNTIVEPINISIGTLVNNTYEYVPMGVFKLDTAPTTDNGKTTIKMRDYSTNFDVPYNAQEIIEANGGSATMLQILQDICTKCGIELGTTTFTNMDTQVSVWDNSINARVYIMYIAEKAGCIATMSRDGKLILVDLQKGEDIEVEIQNTLYINNALARNINLEEIQGNTTQDETPTSDNPVEIQSVTGEQNVNVYSGKNLFNNNGTMYQSAGATVETINTGIRATILQTGTHRYGKVVIPNSNELLGKTVTLSANFNSSASNTGRIALYQISSTGGVISGIGMLDNTGSTTLTIPSEYSTNAVALALLFYANVSGTSEVNDYVDYTNVQLEKGSSATEYEEYIGQDYKINLGKNLFNKYGDFTYGNQYNETSLNSQGQIVSTSNYRLHRSSGILITNFKQNTDYTMSGVLISATGTDTGNNANIEIRTTSNTQLTLYSFRTSWTKPYNFTFTFNTGDNTSLWFSFNGRNQSSSDTTPLETIFDNIQIEKGSQATSYSKYFEPIKLCKIEDYKDRIYKQNDTWYIEKNIGKVVLDGSENFGKSSSTSADIFSYNTGETSTQGTTPVLSNYFKYANTNTIGSARKYNNYIYLIPSEYGTYTVTQFKTWLSTHNTTVYYVLATPTYTEITNEELIDQLNALDNAKLNYGVNSITITSNNLNMGLKIEYQSIKEPFELNPLLFEKYKVGEKLEISRVVYEDAIRKFEQGTEDKGTLYINTANPYITSQDEINNIYDVVNELAIYSMNISKMRGNPAIDPWDLLKFTYNNQEYVFLGQNTLTFTGNVMQTFDTQIGTNVKSQENVTINSEPSQFKRLFTRMDQAEGNIELNASQITNVQTTLQENYYTSEQTEQLILNSETGLTNTFSEAGGNNIFRNTGLWFTQSDSNNPYEFWTGIVEKVREEKSASTNALLLQNTTLIQEQDVPNGNYTISFKYKKLIQASQVKCVINDVEYILTATEDTEFVQPIEVNSQHINIKFISNIDNACEIYDLMVNAGAVKLAYSQNQNETTTDTVNISKGITITSSQMETTFKANADGVRIYDSKDLTTPKTEFTDRGMETDYLKVKNEAEIVSILIQKVGNHTWFTKI